MNIELKKKLLAPTRDDLKRSAFKIYEKARMHSHWNPKTDIDYQAQTGLPDNLQELAWRIASQSVFTEQVGMMTAARLLNETDDIVIRYCLATAVSDEAKHSEVFARYAYERGGRIDSESAHANDLFGELEVISDPFGRFIVHSMLEGLAADEFSLFRTIFKGDVLEEIYRRVSGDEARHVAIGLDYMGTVLRDKHLEEHVNSLHHYSQVALEISGLTNPAMQAGLGKLTGRNPDELYNWMLSRHQQRLDHLLKGVQVEV